MYSLWACGKYLQEIVGEYLLIFSGSTLHVTKFFIVKRDGYYFRCSTIYLYGVAPWDDEVIKERDLIKGEFFGE